MFPEDGLMWSNGHLVPWKDATTHVMAHGLHYGSGFFEGIRVYQTDDGPKVFRVDDHVQRFVDSAKVYKFKLPFTKEQIKQGILDVVKANKFQDCYVRPIAFVGYGRLGVYPERDNIEVHIGAWKWGAYLGEEGLTKGVKATFAVWTKFQSRMFPVIAKASGQYLNSMLAVMDAKDRGYDEAILLDSLGNISEGSGENMFLVKNKRLYTNTMSDSILDGITRDTVLKIAQDLGYPITVKSLTPGELLTASEAFFTGTAAEITPIREVDGREIGYDGHWPMTRELQDMFFSIVRGKEARYNHWLTPVY